MKLRFYKSYQTIERGRGERERQPLTIQLFRQGIGSFANELEGIESLLAVITSFAHESYACVPFSRLETNIFTDPLVNV